MPHERPPSPSRLVEAYDAAFRASMPISAAEAEDPVRLREVVAALPGPAADLLALASLVTPVGELRP